MGYGSRGAMTSVARDDTEAWVKDLHLRVATLASDTRPTGAVSQAGRVPPAGNESNATPCGCVFSHEGRKVKGSVVLHPEAATQCLLLRSIWIFNILGIFFSTCSGAPRNRTVSPASSEAMRLSRRRRGTPGAKWAGDRNPTLRGEAQSSWRSEEGSTTGHQTYSGTSPKERGGVCATESGQGRRESGQASRQEQPRRGTQAKEMS